MKWWRGGLLACVFMALPAAAQDTSAAGAAAKRFAGHYYLSGVMETGSELLLSKDGRFQWYISYGAVDQRAEGSWTLRQDRIVLTSDAAGRGAWMRLKGSRDWDAAVEYSRARQLHAEQEALVLSRCSFINAGADAASPPPKAYPPERPDAAILDAQILAQEQRLAGYVARAESAAAAAMAAPESQRDAVMQSATLAMSEYWREQYALKELYWQWPGRIPAYATLALPAACVAPAEPARESDPSTWVPGIAVFVHDDEADAYYSDMPVTLSYADGSQEALLSGSGGYAVSKREDGVMPTALVVGDASTAKQGALPLSIQIPARAKPVLELEFDPEQIGGSAFERMELRVDGTALVPNWEGRGERGRYER